MTATTLTVMHQQQQQQLDERPAAERATYSARAVAPSSPDLYADVPVVVHANEQKALKSEVCTCWAAQCGWLLRGRGGLSLRASPPPRARPHPGRFCRGAKRARNRAWLCAVCEPHEAAASGASWWRAHSHPREGGQVGR